METPDLQRQIIKEAGMENMPAAKNAVKCLLNEWQIMSVIHADVMAQLPYPEFEQGVVQAVDECPQSELDAVGMNREELRHLLTRLAVKRAVHHALKKIATK